MKNADERASSPDFDEPLPSLPLSFLKPSEPEVAHVFALPLSELASRARLRARSFRNDTNRPYWCIDVSDLCLDGPAKDEQVSMLRLTVGADSGSETAQPVSAADREDNLIIGASDNNLASVAAGWEYAHADVRDTGDGNSQEIWGLTAWYLGLFMRTLRVVA